MHFTNLSQNPLKVWARQVKVALIFSLFSYCSFSGVSYAEPHKTTETIKNTIAVRSGTKKLSPGKSASKSFTVRKGQSKTISLNNTAAEAAVEQSQIIPLVKFPNSLGIPSVEVHSRQAILLNDQTGTVLLEKDPDELMHPSSMTKIMTVILACEKIKAGLINSEAEIVVGREGWRTEGSSMFLNINDRVKVIDLLKGIVIHSGNDASIVLAQALAGSEASFAHEMTKRAQELGAHNTTFRNATGLPQDGHHTTARDLAILAHHAIHDEPDYYALYKEKNFTYGNITQGNRNPLLYKNIGCDGIKTGHSSVAGYGMVASCVDQQGARYILVINGLPSAQARANEATRLMTWAMATFANYTLFKAGQIIEEIPVAYGQGDKLALTVEKDLVITLARLGRKDLKVELSYAAPLEAPIQQGASVGKVIVTSSALPAPLEFPLTAAVTLEKSGFFKRIADTFRYAILGMPK